MRNTFRIHAIYVIGILLAFNVLLVTVKWGGIRDLVGYLTFALTLTSLVLAVLAILYAYLSNASVGQQVLTLRTATDDMSSVANEMSESARRLELQLQSIPPLFADVGVKVSETHKFVHDLYSAAEKNAATVAVAKGSDVASDNSLLVERLTRIASLNGLRALYIAYLAFTCKKVFDMTDVAAKVKLEFPYIHGFLIACQACGLINATAKEHVWNVIGFDSALAGRIKADVTSRERDFNDEWSQRVGYDRTLERIDAYFHDSQLPDNDPPPIAEPPAP